jgi:hypothetical protein
MCLCVSRFRNTMDKLNKYMETYRTPSELRDTLRE